MSDVNEDKNRTFEVRFYLKKRFAEAARQGQTVRGMKPLLAVLEKHGASLQNQLDEFQEQLFAWQEIGNWDELFPDAQSRANEMRFEKFTLSTVLNDSKREYLSREFTLVVGDKKFFSGDEVDALVADIESLGAKIIGTGPRIKEPVTRRVYSDNGGPHSYATGIIPQKKL